jgi:predicted PurR-regulated permease PerM
LAPALLRLERDKRRFGSAKRETKMELFLHQKNLYRFLVFFLCAVICIFVFYPFLTSIAVAAIFAQVLSPLVSRLQNFRFRNVGVTCRKKCTAMVMVVMLAIVSLPFGVVGKKVYGEAVEFSNTEVAKQRLVMKISNYMGQFETEISNYIKKLGLTRQLTVEDVSGGMANKAANFIFDVGAKALAGMPGVVIKLLIFSAALFYFLAESDKIKSFLKRTGIFSKREMKILRESFRVSSHAAVVSTILAGLIHGCIVAVGAQLQGAGDFYVIFVLTFFLSFIPVIGATLVAVGLCGPALLAQNYSGALILLGIALFASAVDNLIRPWFMIYGNKLVHPFISLLSVLGGMALFGVSGLFIGPVLVQVTFDVLPKLMRLSPNQDYARINLSGPGQFQLGQSRGVTVDDFNI